jgi:drug/metabolite transporter (DMT)-like permease
MSKKTYLHAKLIFLLLIGIIGISFSAIFVKWTEIPTSIVAMYRLILGACLLFPWVYMQKSEITRLTGKAWILLIASGFSLALHFMLWMESLRYTSVASSTTINALQPIFVMIGSYLLFHILVSRLALLGMIVAFIGVLGMGWGDFYLGTDALYGDLLSLLGALAVAVHVMIGKQLRSYLSASIYSGIVFLISALFIAIYNVIQHYSFVALSRTDVLMVVCLAVVSTLLGHHIFNYLLKEMKATSVAMGVLGEPVGGSILAFVLLNEQITGLQFASGFVIIFAIGLFIQQHEKKSLEDRN